MLMIQVGVWSLVDPIIRWRRPFVKAGKPAGNGLLLGYARVSKGDDQTNTLQARALRAAGCRRIGGRVATEPKVRLSRNRRRVALLAVDSCTS